MKKSDLKTGMLVKQRNGDLSLVMIGTPKGDILTDKLGTGVSCEGGASTYVRLCEYHDDLTYIHGELDIVKVYSPTRWDKLLSFDTSDFELIWQRDPQIELTLTVNGKEVSPCDISEETWKNLRK